MPKCLRVCLSVSPSVSDSTAQTVLFLLQRPRQVAARLVLAAQKSCRFRRIFRHCSFLFRRRHSAGGASILLCLLVVLLLPVAAGCWCCLLMWCCLLLLWCYLPLCLLCCCLVLLALCTPSAYIILTSAVQITLTNRLSGEIATRSRIPFGVSCCLFAWLAVYPFA